MFLKTQNQLARIKPYDLVHLWGLGFEKGSNLKCCVSVYFKNAEMSPFL